MLKDRIWGLPRNVFFAGITSLLNDVSGEMIVAIFPAFFKAVLKSGAASLGLVEGVADAASNLFKIVSGQWSDKIQKRKIFGVFGYGISTLVRPLYLLANQVGMVLGLRLTDRVGKGLRDAPRDSLISLSTPATELGRSFGFHRAMDTLGAITGPFIAFLILRRYPGAFHTIFITAFFFGILGVASFSLVKEVVAPALSGGKMTVGLGGFSGRFKAYVVSTFVLSCGVLPITVLLLRSGDSGLSIADIPLFYMLYNISYAGFSPLAGRLADLFGDRLVILSGYGFLLFGYLILNYSAQLHFLLAGFVMVGMYSALTDAVTRSYAGRLTEPGLRGTAFGYLNAAAGLGALVAGVGGGWIWQTYGSGVAFSFGGGVVAVGSLIFFLSQLKSDLPAEKA